MRTTRLSVTLQDVDPTVRRVIDVPASIVLDELHDVLQVAVGWTDSHLHQFRTTDRTYAAPFDDWNEDEIDERGVRLSRLPSRFVYAYDFGDGWEHEVEVLGRGAEEPGCVDGEGSCPPEDCGGPYGFTQLLAVLNDPAHPQHEDLRRWVGARLRPFDLPGTSGRVADAVGRVPDSVRLLLELLGDGVKLTPGGRLPRTVVRAVQKHRPDWYPLGRPASIEEDLPPLAELHDLLCRVGLCRLSGGVLRPTKAAGDPVEVVRRLRSWFEPNQFDTVVVERTAALVAARGAMSTTELASNVLPMLGHGWQRSGEPVTEADVERQLHRLRHQLVGLDIIGASWSSWEAGSSVTSLLPGAGLLADLF